MELQAIRFKNDVYCTVFVVQNQEITIMAKSSGTPDFVRKWLQSQGYPSAGVFLRPKEPGVIATGYYINPGLGPFYYQVDPETDQLTGISPQEFERPSATENI